MRAEEIITQRELIAKRSVNVSRLIESLDFALKIWLNSSRIYFPGKFYILACCVWAQVAEIEVMTGSIAPRMPLEEIGSSVEEELKQSLRQLEAIYYMTTTVSRAANLPEIYEAALECLETTLHVDRASVLLFDEMGVMRFQAWRGISEEYRQRVDGHSPWSPQEKDARPIVVANVAAAPELGELRDVILTEGICAIAFIPLISSGRLLGKFMLYYNQPHELREEEIHLAESIASQVAFAIDRKQADEALQRAKDDLERRVEARTTLLKNQITERKRAEGALRKEAGFVQLLQRVAVAANEAASVEAAMQYALDEICAHTGWPVGHVFVSEANTGNLVSARIWSLDDPEQFQEFKEVTEASRFRSGESLPGQVLATGKPKWIADVYQAPDFMRAGYVQGINVRAGFAFPVVVGAEVAAVLEFFATEIVEPDEALLAVAANIGRQLGRVIERDRAETALKKSQAQLRRLAQQVVTAQEEERRRVSRELHDEAGQALTVLKMNLTALQDELPPELDYLHERLSAIVELTDETMDQIRLLAHALHPPALENLGLNIALEALCRDFGERARLVITYRGQDGVELPGEVNISFYRFLQEALTNVAKHAQADRVEVLLQNESSITRLIVADNGSGFDVGASKTLANNRGGLGLLGMRERFEQLGGELEIESQIGRGTRLVASYPRVDSLLDNASGG